MGARSVVFLTYLLLLLSTPLSMRRKRYSFVLHERLRVPDPH